MKHHLKWASTLFAFLMLASCGNKGVYSGFEKMESGAYMKFYSKGNSEVMPRLNDEATFEMAQYFNDSLLFTTVGDEPMRIVLTKPDFEGDVADALLMMHVGDSARLMVLADSVFTVMLQMEEIPEEYAGMPIYYDLKLLSVKPFEELEAERKAMLDSLRLEEEEFLTSLRDDSKNTLTESGIIVMEKTGKGRVARMGEYVDFDFTMCSPKGDTIMNSFGVEPVEIQYGEEFLGEGFTEAIGMVPEGGTMLLWKPRRKPRETASWLWRARPSPITSRLKVSLRPRRKLAFTSFARKKARAIWPSGATKLRFIMC